MQITAASNMILLVKEVKNTMANINQSIFVGENMFDPLNRYGYRSEEGENIKEKKKVAEFLHRKVYGCEVMLSNMSVRS
jgi:methyl coenzyme M reductase gamma subunit